MKDRLGKAAPQGGVTSSPRPLEIFFDDRHSRDNAEYDDQTDYDSLQQIPVIDFGHWLVIVHNTYPEER